VYEAPCFVQPDDADQPDREHEKCGLQKHRASVTALMTVLELRGIGAESRRETVAAMISS
jgi:hypothetical protein